MCVGVWERNGEGKFYKWLKSDCMDQVGLMDGYLFKSHPKIWGGCSLETKNMIDVDKDKDIYTQTHIQTCQKESFYGIPVKILVHTIYFHKNQKGK